MLSFQHLPGPVSYQWKLGRVYLRIGSAGPAATKCQLRWSEYPPDQNYLLGRPRVEWSCVASRSERLVAALTFADGVINDRRDPLSATTPVSSLASLHFISTAAARWRFVVFCCYWSGVFILVREGNESTRWIIVVVKIKKNILACFLYVKFNRFIL